MAQDQQVKITIDAVNKSAKAFSDATKDLEKTEAAAKKASDSFKLTGIQWKGLGTDVTGLAKMLAGGLVIGLGAATAAAISCAKAFGEAQAQTAKMDAMLKAAGGNFEKNREQILEAAKAAAQLGFDDEKAATSMAFLYQRTGDVTEAIKLNALAMDLARAKSMDLEQASQMISLVMSGNARALKQFGIEIDETLGPMEALKQLQSVVAGQAESFAGTFEGKMQTLSESWTNLKEIVGESIVEAITPFIDQLSAWANNPDVQKKIKEISKEIGLWMEVTIPVLIETLKMWWSWLQTIISGMTTLGTWILNIIDYIEQLIKAIARLAAQSWGKVGSFVGNVQSGFGVVKGALGFDDGGIVPGALGQPQMAVVHGGETILPTHKGAAVGATVNIYNPVLLDDSMVDRLSEQVARALRRDFRY